MRVTCDRFMNGVDVAARKAWLLALFVGQLISFIPNLRWLQPGLVVILLFSWAYNRWHDQLPWLGGISALPWEPNDGEVRVWNFWVKFWAATAMVLLVLEAFLPPVIDFTTVPLGLAGCCALVLSHIAMLRDLVFEWRFTVMVVMITGLGVAVAPISFSVILVPFFATLGAFFLRKLHLSSIGEVAYKPMLVAAMNQGVKS